VNGLAVWIGVQGNRYNEQGMSRVGRRRNVLLALIGWDRVSHQRAPHCRPPRRRARVTAPNAKETDVNPTYDFTGHVAVVTGASSGMGRATAQALAQAGAAAVLADINADALRVATEVLTGSGHRALDVTCDVSDEAQVAAVVDEAVGADLREQADAFRELSTSLARDDA
jgi:hypothetical protein